MSTSGICANWNFMVMTDLGFFVQNLTFLDFLLLFSKIWQSERWDNILWFWKENFTFSWPVKMRKTSHQTIFLWIISLEDKVFPPIVLISMCMHAHKIKHLAQLVINPWCAARVTVVGFVCVCLSVNPPTHFMMVCLAQKQCYTLIR